MSIIGDKVPIRLGVQAEALILVVGSEILYVTSGNAIGTGIGKEIGIGIGRE